MSWCHLVTYFLVYTVDILLKQRSAWNEECFWGIYKITSLSSGGKLTKWSSLLLKRRLPPSSNQKLLLNSGSHIGCQIIIKWRNLHDHCLIILSQIQFKHRDFIGAITHYFSPATSGINIGYKSKVTKIICNISSIHFVFQCMMINCTFFFQLFLVSVAT